MLLSRQIDALAEDLLEEARNRPYIHTLLGNLAADGSFWRLLLEMLEVTLHKRGYVIVSRNVLDQHINKL